MCLGLVPGSRCLYKYNVMRFEPQKDVEKNPTLISGTRSLNKTYIIQIDIKGGILQCSSSVDGHEFGDDKEHHQQRQWITQLKAARLVVRATARNFHLGQASYLALCIHCIALGGVVLR